MALEFDVNRTSKAPAIKRFLFRFLLFVLETALAIGLAYAIIEYAMERTVMTGVSMEATLEDGTAIIINKLSYIKKAPKRFDVIVFKQMGVEHSYYNVKRVIGLPGETVSIANGAVYINGELLEEPVEGLEPIHLAGLAEKEFVLDTDEYFVLGDNRNQSEDSRFANIGNITREEIIGKAWITVNPFDIISLKNLKQEEAEE